MATLFANNTENPDTINQNRFGAKRTALYDQAGNMLVLFDAVIKENHTFDSEISNHPAEDGTQFSDMQTAQPVSVTLDIVRSNHPIEALSLDDFTQMGAGLAAGLVLNEVGQDTEVIIDQQTGEVTTVTTGVPLPTQNRVAAVGTALALLTEFLNEDDIRHDVEAFQALRKSQLTSTRLIIVTPFISYNSMLLKSINVGKDASSSQALVASLTFQEVQVFSTQSREVEARGTTGEVVDKQQPKSEQGLKNTTEASTAQVEKVNKTWAASGLDFIFGAQ